MENYVLYEELGKGTCSVVYKGRKKGSVEYVAVHCAEKTKRKELQNIVRITHELSHENIVTFYEWYETTNHIWMIMELCTGQSLSVMLEQDGCFPEKTVRSFGLDIANGLHYLHGLGILYCDLRCSKLILDGYGKVKLSNFALAKVEDEDELDDDNGHREDSRRPSPMYMAPEVLQGHSHSVSSELWSFGCVLYELFTGNLPFEGDSFSELVNKIMTQNLLYPLQVIDGVELGPSDEFYSLVQSLLCKDSGSRLSWNELLRHRFWEGGLRLSVDGMGEDVEQEQSIKLEQQQKPVLEQEKPVLVEVEQKELGVLASNEDHCLEKSDFGQVRSKNMGGKPNSKGRPGTAPESSSLNIRHGTYKVEQLRPHTTQSDLTKTRKLTKKEIENKSNVSASQKSRTPRKKAHSHNATSAVTSDEKLQKSHTNDVSKPESNGQSQFGQNAAGTYDVESLLYHPSDFVVTSIVGNPKIKKIVVPKWDAKTIGMTTLTVEQLLSTSSDEQVKYFVEISRLLEQQQRTSGQAGGQRSKLHCASYLASILQNADVANLVVNSHLVFGLLQMIKQSSSADLKARLGLALGFLASNATLISDTFNMSEVFMVLSETIRDNFRNSKLKQSLLPCLGEFLFYAATQEESEGKMNENWEVPGITFTIITKCLREGEDSIVQHYAAKTIENVATTDTQYYEKFATAETAQMLWNLFTHCSGDSQKWTAISALCRLTGHSVALFQHVIDNAGLRTVLNCLVSGVTKVQQAIITMLAALVSKGAHMKRLIEEKEFIHKMMHFLDSPSIVIRSKAFVAIAAMSRENKFVSRDHYNVSREHTVISRENHVALLHCCQSKLVTYIERDTKRQTPVKADGDVLDYLKNCLNLCIQTVCHCVPKVITNLLNALQAVWGRKHPSAVQSKELKSCIPLLSIVLHLVTSNVFRDRVVDETFVKNMGQLAAHVASIDKGTTGIGSTPRQFTTDNLTNIVLSIIEAVAQHSSLLLQYRGLVIENVLPHLAVLTSSNEGDVRMFCFKMFADMAAMFLDSESLGDDQGKESALQLSKLISSELLPQYDTILRDQDPLPSYALKLLLAFLEHSPSFSEAVIDKGVVEILGEILERHDDDVSGSAVQTIVSLLDCLVSSTADLWPLYEQGLIDHVTTLFVSGATLITHKDSEQNFSEVILPLLDTVHGIMKYSSKVVREAFQAKSAGNGDVLTEKAEKILLEGKPLVELTGVLVQFLCHYDPDIQEWSLRCLYQVVELFGGTYEDAMSAENIACFAEALLASDSKKQKQILRIIKRVVTSSTWHAAALKEHGDALLDALVQITKVENATEDTNAVKSLVVEITKATGIA